MERLKRFAILMLVPLLGCTKLGHMPQLVTLKKLSDDQAMTDAYVDGQEEKFSLMLQEMNDGQFDRYTDQDQIRQKFGEPVFVKELDSGSREKVMWMYRRPVNYSNIDKVYLYFDGKGQLLSYKRERSKG